MGIEDLVGHDQINIKEISTELKTKPEEEIFDFDKEVSKYRWEKIVAATKEAIKVVASEHFRQTEIFTPENIEQIIKAINAVDADQFMYWKALFNFKLLFPNRIDAVYSPDDWFKGEKGLKTFSEKEITFEIALEMAFYLKFIDPKDFDFIDNTKLKDYMEDLLNPENLSPRKYFYFALAKIVFPDLMGDLKINQDMAREIINDLGRIAPLNTPKRLLAIKILLANKVQITKDGFEFDFENKEDFVAEQEKMPIERKY